jgi:hypothetical protein
MWVLGYRRADSTCFLSNSRGPNTSAICVAPEANTRGVVDGFDCATSARLKKASRYERISES